MEPKVRRSKRSFSLTLALILALILAALPAGLAAEAQAQRGEGPASALDDPRGARGQPSAGTSEQAPALPSETPEQPEVPPEVRLWAPHEASGVAGGGVAGGGVAGGRAEVRFEAASPHAIYVRGQGCVTPCTLDLEPGRATVLASGRLDVEASLEIPSWASTVEISDPGRASRLAGAVMLPVGFLMAASFWTLGFLCDEWDGSCRATNYILWPVLGVGMAISGGSVLGAAGRFGAAARLRGERRASDLSLRSLSFAPTQGGAAGSLLLSF